jgi:hypothetical protein
LNRGTTDRANKRPIPSAKNPGSDSTKLYCFKSNNINFGYPMKRHQLILILCAAYFAVLAGEPKKAITPHLIPTIRFTENNGQWDSRVLMRATLPGGAMFIERDRLTFNFYDRKKLMDLHNGGLANGVCKDPFVNGHAYRMVFEGASLNPTLEKMQAGADYENFFIGNDPDRWKGNVMNYAQVWLRNLYKGIDYEVLGAANSTKYNFHVKPGSDPSDIKIRFEGAEKVSIKNGKLEVRTVVNEVSEERPYAYQLIDGQVKEIVCEFALRENVLSFIFPKGFDKTAELVIDPLLVFSAQIGSTADNFGMSATYDASGNLYSGGTVYSAGYPFVTGSYDNTFNNPTEFGRTDVFITKYSANGSALLYSTYLGGNSTEVCSSLMVDGSGNLCLYGATGSTNFPVTAGAWDATFNGGTNIGFVTNGSIFRNGTDIFIARFNSAGTALLGSTYFGGSDNDGINYLEAVTPVSYYLSPSAGTATTYICGYDSLMTNYGDQFRGEIRLDTLNNIYVCSSTRSWDMPVAGGFDNSLNGKQDAVVIKFNSNLTSLLYSTYLGGSKIDCGNALFIHASGDIFVTGGTCSNDMPGTTGAHSATYNGGKCDGFLAKINGTGGLSKTTYIGTGSYDNSFFVQCDKFGDVYVFGQSLGNIPVQARGTSPVYSVSGTHQFVACYNSSLINKLMSTVFGGKTNAFDISPSAFTIDDCSGNIYISGWGGGLLSPNNSAMSNMPLANANQSTTTGYDFYLMALKKNASAFLYGTYFGGASSAEHVDGGTSRFDSKGILYQSVCAGCAGNQDFPWTAGAWPCPNASTCASLNLSGNCNNGVFKINFDMHADVDTTYTTANTTCAPVTLTLVNSFSGTSYLWTLANGDTTSVVSSPVITFTSSGTYSVLLFVRDAGNVCVTEKFQMNTFHVPAGPVISVMANPASICAGATATLSALGAVSYTWSGAGNGTGANISFSKNIPQNYIVAVAGTGTNGCTTHTQVNFSVLPNPQVVAFAIPQNVCVNDIANISVTGASSYTWSGSSNSASNSFSFVPGAAQAYTFNVKGKGTNGCIGEDNLVLLVNECTSINENKIVHSLAVYPNPNDGNFKVTAGGPTKVLLVNEPGQIIKTLELTAINNFETNVSGVSPGIYFLTWSEAGVEQTIRIVVLKY